MLDAGHWMLDAEHGRALRCWACIVGGKSVQAAFLLCKLERSMSLSISALTLSI